MGDLSTDFIGLFGGKRDICGGFFCSLAHFTGSFSSLLLYKPRKGSYGSVAKTVRDFLNGEMRFSAQQLKRNGENDLILVFTEWLSCKRSHNMLNGMSSNAEFGREFREFYPRFDL